MQPIIKRSQATDDTLARPAVLPELLSHGPDEESESAACKPAAKEARLVRIDGEVCAIEVRCACGEWTTVELEYEAVDKSQSSEVTP